jgi:hypothetical protein
MRELDHLHVTPNVPACLRRPRLDNRLVMSFGLLSIKYPANALVPAHATQTDPQVLAWTSKVQGEQDSTQVVMDGWCENKTTSTTPYTPIPNHLAWQDLHHSNIPTTLNARRTSNYPLV